METIDKKYDAILVVDPTIEEAYDERSFAKRPPGYIQGFKAGMDYIDPKLYASSSFGNWLQNRLSNMSRGLSAKVTDFGKWVVVDAQSHNFATGRTSSKTFLVVFKEKGDGIILSTSNKYRTISGVDQAASYIVNSLSSLSSSNQSVI